MITRDKENKPPLIVSPTKKYYICPSREGCPPDMTKNPGTGNCIKTQHLKNGCPPGKMIIPGAGQWEKLNGESCLNPNIDKCMEPVHIRHDKGSKTGTTPTWSLPRGETCPGKTPLCNDHCYATKGEFAYRKGVLPSRKRNLYSSKQPYFVNEMVKEIKKISHTTGQKYFRIHESGDFYNKQYRDKWYEIIRRCPEIKFLAYTKMCSWDWNDRPSNLNVFCSIWPDSTQAQKNSQLPKAYCIDKGKGEVPQYRHDTSGLLCPEQTYPDTHPEYHAGCDKCKYCWEKQKPVLFEIH